MEHRAQRHIVLVLVSCLLAGLVLTASAQMATGPIEPGAGGAPRPLRTSLCVPAEHAQGAEGVPPARPALALVRLDRHRAGVPGLERPPAVAVALGRDQVDRLGHALVGSHTGTAEGEDSGGMGISQCTPHEKKLKKN